jgi:hypothetical protein
VGPGSVISSNWVLIDNISWVAENCTRIVTNWLHVHDGSGERADPVEPSVSLAHCDEKVDSDPSPHDPEYYA